MAQMQPPARPTMLDRSSHRPAKKARTTASSAQSDAVAALFEKQPEIHIPESATRGPRTSDSLAPPPEIVANVQGSSAGAGSGEFHVYKASRRREYERIRIMEEEAKREEEQKAWEEKQRATKEAEEAKLSKNRKRREKKKLGRKKEKGVESAEGGGGTVKLKPMQIKKKDESDGEEDGGGGVAADAPVAEEENGIIMHDDD